MGFEEAAARLSVGRGRRASRRGAGLESEDREPVLGGGACAAMGVDGQVAAAEWATAAGGALPPFPYTAHRALPSCQVNG